MKKTLLIISFLIGISINSQTKNKRINSKNYNFIFKVLDKSYQKVNDKGEVAYSYLIKSNNTEIILNNDKCIIKETDKITVFKILSNEISFDNNQTKIIIKAVQDNIKYDMELLAIEKDKYIFLIKNDNITYVYTINKINKELKKLSSSNINIKPKKNEDNDFIVMDSIVKDSKLEYFNKKNKASQNKNTSIDAILIILFLIFMVVLIYYYSTSSNKTLELRNEIIELKNKNDNLSNNILNSEKSEKKKKAAIKLTNNPMKKNIISSVNSLNTRTVRTDGYYFATYKGKGNYDNIVELHFILLFSESNYVYRIEVDGNDIDETNSINSNRFKETIKLIIQEFNSLDKLENTKEQTNHFVNENGEITIKFFDANEELNNNNSIPVIYDEWKGNIVKDGLILSLGNTFLDYELNKISHAKSRIKNLKFDFKTVNLKMNTTELAKFVEDKMISDIKQYINDKNIMGARVESIDLMMCMAHSQKNMTELLIKNNYIKIEQNIDNILQSAYHIVFSKIFDTEQTDENNNIKKINTIFAGTIELYTDIKEKNQDKMIWIKIEAGGAPDDLLLFEDEYIEAGFEIGKSYLIACNEFDLNGFREFKFKAIQEINKKEFNKYINELGKANYI